MKKLLVIGILFLITSINTFAMKTNPKKRKRNSIPSQYHPIGFDKKELPKATLAMQYISFFHKHLRYGGNKEQRANYRACQAYLNEFFKTNYGAQLSDDENDINNSFDFTNEIQKFNIPNLLNKLEQEGKLESSNQESFYDEINLDAFVFPNNNNKKNDKSEDNEPIIPAWLFKTNSQSTSSDSDSEYKSDSDCPLPSFSSSNNNDPSDHCPSPSLSSSENSSDYPTNIFNTDYEAYLDTDGSDSLEMLDGPYF